MTESMEESMEESMAYERLYSRNILFWGEEKQRLLAASSVTICGLGGVGSYVAEALVRCGVGKLILIDGDCVEVSNINRQLQAAVSTIGMRKVEACARHIRDVFPDCQVVCRPNVICGENVGELLADSGYIVDAIDDLPAKVAIAVYANQQGIPLIAAMGAAKRLDILKLEIADLSKSHTCPLARRYRKELKNAGVSQGIPVVFSRETPLVARQVSSVLPSVTFVPGAMGLLIAAHVVKTLLADKEEANYGSV